MQQHGMELSSSMSLSLPPHFSFSRALSLSLSRSLSLPISLSPSHARSLSNGAVLGAPPDAKYLKLCGTLDFACKMAQATARIWP